MSTPRKRAQKKARAGEVLEEEGKQTFSLVEVTINYQGKREPSVRLMFDDDGIVGADVLDEAVEAVDAAISKLESS